MLIKNLVKNSFKILSFIFLIACSVSISQIPVSAADISIAIYVGSGGTDGQGTGVCNFDNGNNFCKAGEQGKSFQDSKSFRAYKDCSQSALPDKTISTPGGDTVIPGLPIAACSSSFKTYAVEPNFITIKTDATTVTNGTGTGATPNLAYSTNKYKVNLTGKTETVDLQCDFGNKACGIQTNATTGLTYSGCVKKTDTTAECTAKISDTFISLKSELATASVAAKVDVAGASKPGGAGGDTNLADKLLGLVIALVTLLVFIFSTVAYFVLYLFAFLFIFFVKINPASNDWITVAQAPWGVVQSLANLLILASFIFVAFSYILNIKQYKTKIDSFLTNIVIVAIVVQLTLLGAASIINITQGVGDAFVAGYVSIQGGNISNPDDISKAFIGSTVDTFKKVSLVRCRTSYIESPIIKTLASGLSVDVSAQAAPATPAPGTPPVQTIKQANKASECTNTNDFGNLSGVGGTLGDAFTKGVGENLTTLLREIIYLIVTGLAIYAFYKIMMLAFTRAIVLWLLMVTSPLALVAFFAPEGLQTKKMADKWGGTFFHYAIFYPAFVFGLILVQELTGAFAKSAENGVKSIASGLQPQKELVTILLGAVVAVGALHLLAEFFEKGAKEISGAAWGGVKAAASVGAAGLRAAAPLAGGAVGGTVGKALSWGASRDEQGRKDRIARLTTERDNHAVGSNAYQSADLAIKAQQTSLKFAQQRKGFYNDLGANTTKKLTGLANFTEMLPERLEEAGKVPGYIGSSWAKQKKARIDSFREGDRLRGELFVRGNSKLFGAVGVDADNDPKASLRGVEQDELRESKSSDPDYVKNIVSQGVKSAYAKSLGNDQKIARNLVAKKIARILKAANGDMSKIDPKDWDFVNESLQQHGNDGFVMSQLAQDPKSREMIGYAMDNNYLNTDVQQNLRQRNPIFVTDGDERQALVTNMSASDRKDIPGINYSDPRVYAGAIAAGDSELDVNKKYRATGTAPVADEKAMKADIKSNPIKLSDGGQSRTVNMTDEAAARIINFQRAQSNKDISAQGEILGKIAGERLANPDMTTEQARVTYDDVMTKHFGEESAIEAIANDPTMSAQEKITQLNRGSNNMRSYYQANAAKFATIADKNEVVAEMIAANNKSRESNKSVADLHFQVLDQSAKAGKSVLIESNAATAASNLSAAAYGNAAIRGHAAMVDTNFQAEIGVQGYAKNIVKTEVLNPTGSLSSLVDDGLEDTFSQHLESITTASLDGDQTKIDNAFRDAKTALASNPAAVDYLQDKFGSVDPAGNFTTDRLKMQAVRTASQAVGQAEVVKMETKMKNEMNKKGVDFETARNNNPGLLDSYANEVFEAREVEAKANSKKAQEKAVDKGKAIPYGQASDVIRRNQAPQQTSRTNNTRPAPPAPTVIAPPPQVVTQSTPDVTGYDESNPDHNFTPRTSQAAPNTTTTSSQTSSGSAQTSSAAQPSQSQQTQSTQPQNINTPPRIVTSSTQQPRPVGEDIVNTSQRNDRQTEGGVYVPRSYVENSPDQARVEEVAVSTPINTPPRSAQSQPQEPTNPNTPTQSTPQRFTPLGQGGLNPNVSRDQQSNLTQQSGQEQSPITPPGQVNPNAPSALPRNPRVSSQSDNVTPNTTQPFNQDDSDIDDPWSTPPQPPSE